MRISNKLIIIGVVVLIALIFFTVFLTNLLRKEKPEETNERTTSPERSSELQGKRTKISTYKNTSPEFTKQENELINRVKETLPYESDNLDILFSEEVGQFIVSKKTDAADDEFQKWLKDKSLDDVYQKYPGLFAESNLPKEDYLYLIDKFKNEPESLPKQSQFDLETKSRVDEEEVSENKDLQLLVDLMKTLFSFDLGTPSSETVEPTAKPEGEKSDLAKLLPGPLPPISTKAFGYGRQYILQECTKNKGVYQQAQEKTGVNWEILLGIHYREGSCRSNASVISGRTIGVPEPDNGGRVYHSLLETAIAAASEFKGKIGGHPPRNFEELIAASQRFHGTGGRNCGQTSLYKGPCPPPDGIDDPYPVNFFDEDHSTMYKIYCADHVKCNPPQLDTRHGVATIVRILFKNE